MQIMKAWTEVNVKPCSQSIFTTMNFHVKQDVFKNSYLKQGQSE